ncbi:MULTISPECIES: flagellar protein FlhE [Pseudomonas]|nr:flagellar protein FlhE [Pseudomonas mosselii]
MLKTFAFAMTATGLAVFSTTASAGEYQSSVMLPAVFAKNYDYTAYLPVKGSPPSNVNISNVTWNWSVVGWPDQFSVRLCAGTASNCIDVSRQRSSSTNSFFAHNPNKQFFYILRAGTNTLVPVGGQEGKITVQW